MREVKIGDRTIQIRGITRKAFKKHKLADLGFDFFNGVVMETVMDNDGAIDKFISAAVPELSPDDFTPGEWNKLFLEVIRETYGSKEEEKNLSTPGTAS